LILTRKAACLEALDPLLSFCYRICCSTAGVLSLGVKFFASDVFDEEKLDYESLLDLVHLRLLNITFSGV
jgi:hypothetical protein